MEKFVQLTISLMYVHARQDIMISDLKRVGFGHGNTIPSRLDRHLLRGRVKPNLLEEDVGVHPKVGELLR